MAIVRINEGAVPWQIFQQAGGKADITIKGAVDAEMEKEDKVYARVIRQDNYMALVDWTGAQMNGKDYEVTLSDVPAGGLYAIETVLANSLINIEWARNGEIIQNIGVGDLYVIAGQSNAAGYGKTVISDPPVLGVHLFKNSCKWALAVHPLSDSTDTRHPVNDENVISGHSPYLNFGRILNQALNYPIGLIQTARGASPLSRWNPEEDGDLYRNMIDVIRQCGNKIKGVLWYQGCSDACAGAADTYLSRFETMVNAVRRELADPALDFLTVQLNKCSDPSMQSGYDTYWGIIREQQRLAVKKIKHVYVVPSIDLGLSDGIHNSSAANMVIGERLAYSALKHIYNKNYKADAPDIARAILISKDEIELRFDNVGAQLVPIPKADFYFEDSFGPIQYTAYENGKLDSLIFKLEREAREPVYVSFASQVCPSSVHPLDRQTGMPPLAFYRFAADKGRN